MDSDCEIEYLDEDAELVQSCIETMKSEDIKYQVSEKVVRPPKKLGKPRVVPTDANRSKICIQREDNEKSPQKRKWISRDEEDSDYKPNAESDDSDFEIGKPEYDPNRSRKKRQPSTKPPPQLLQKSGPTIKVTVQPQAYNKRPQIVPKPEVVYLPSPPISRIAPASRNVAKQSNIARIVANANKRKANSPSRDTKLLKTFAQKLKMNPNISVKKVAGNDASKRTHRMIAQRKNNVAPPPQNRTSSNQMKIPSRNLTSVQLKDYRDPRTQTRIKINSSDSLKRWNQACNAQAQKTSTQAKSTKTVQTIKKVVPKMTTGPKRPSTKLHLESRVDGKLENLVVFLPTIDTLDSFKVNFEDKGKTVSSSFKSCMLLTMEASKDFVGLVAYNPKQQRVTTYKQIKDQNGTSTVNISRVEARMKMLMTCRMCVSCYQYSWRGGKDKRQTGKMKCAICDGVFTSAYNLLSHLRSHELSPLQKRRQNALLAEIMPYHYKCRICKFQCDSIPSLRRHLKKHQGTDQFTCIVGNHLAR